MKNFESLTVSDYLDIARRRIWYATITTVLVSAGTVAYAWQLPSIYKSETTIAISNRFLPENYLPSIDRQTINDRMDFVRQELQSRTFLGGIVQEFGLAGPDGEVRASEVLQSKIEIAITTPNTFKLGFPATEPGLAQAITKRLAERVIELNDSSRKEKVQLADQFLEQQLKQAGDELSEAEQKLLAFRNRAFRGVTTDVVTPEALGGLEEQLARLDVQLEGALDQRKLLERRLEDHRHLKMALNAPLPPPRPAPEVRASTIVPPPVAPSPPSPLETELAAKRAALAAASIRYTPLHPDVIRLTEDVRELEALVQKAKPAIPQPAPAAPSVAAAEPREDREPAPAIPEFDAELDAVPADIQLQMGRLDRDIVRMQQSKELLRAKISSYQTRLNPPTSIAEDLTRLMRDSDAAKQRYNLLLVKRSDSNMAARADSSESNEMFRVIDPAFLPRKPIGPNRRLVASLGSLAGLVLGFGLAFLREFMDSTLHTEDDLAAEINLPILASIPSIPEPRAEKQEKPPNIAIIPGQGKAEEAGAFSLRYVDSKIRNVILNPLCYPREHYRLLHTQLLALKKSRPHLKTILISSARAGEGKTFSSCCIAGILAEEPGKRVLLIDGDLRSASATNVLGFRHGQVPYNFTTLLRGRSHLEESVIRCDDLNFYLLSAGQISSNPGEVLTWDHLERALHQCAGAFDWVIVDSPPIMTSADGILMSAFCDAVVLVVQSGKTPVKVLKDSIKRIGDDRISGILMNRVKIQQSSYYERDYYQPPSKKSSQKSMLQLRDKD
jgi:polysaccharide chain length determinant protein (PEP-CTERM system associated)